MPKVTIYSTPTCVYCNMAKKYFDENDVDYEDVDVSKDQSKAKEMVEKSGQMGTPVITVGEGDNEEVIVGFQKNLLAEKLDLN